MNLIEDLQWRGLLADCTDLDALNKRLSTGPITLYCGFDPTGDSLHVAISCLSSPCAASSSPATIRSASPAVRPV